METNERDEREHAGVHGSPERVPAALFRAIANLFLLKNEGDGSLSSRTDTSLLSACDEFEEQPDFFVAAFKKQRERLEESLPGKGREVTEYGNKST